MNQYNFLKIILATLLVSTNLGAAEFIDEDKAMAQNIIDSSEQFASNGLDGRKRRTFTMIQDKVNTLNNPTVHLEDETKAITTRIIIQRKWKRL